MLCPSCGKNIPDKSAFCLHCGTRIPSLTTPTILEDQTNAQKRRDILRNIANIIPLILFIGIITIFFLTGRQQTPPQTANTLPTTDAAAIPTSPNSPELANGIKLSLVELYTGKVALENGYTEPIEEGWQGVMMWFAIENTTTSTISTPGSLCGILTDTGNYQRDVTIDYITHTGYERRPYTNLILPPNIRVHAVKATTKIPQNQQPKSLTIYAIEPSQSFVQEPCTSKKTTDESWSFDLQSPPSSVTYPFSQTSTSTTPTSQDTVITYTKHNSYAAYTFTITNFHFEDNHYGFATPGSPGCNKVDLYADYSIENTGGNDLNFRDNPSQEPYLSGASSAGDYIEIPLPMWATGTTGPGIQKKGTFGAILNFSTPIQSTYLHLFFNPDYYTFSQLVQLQQVAIPVPTKYQVAQPQCERQ